MIEEKVTWDLPAVICGNEVPKYLKPNHVGRFTRYFPMIKCIRCRTKKYITDPYQDPVFCEDCYQEMGGCVDPSHCTDCLKIWSSQMDMRSRTLDDESSLSRNCIINPHQHPGKCNLDNFHTTNCTWCHIRGIKNVNHPQRGLHGFFVQTSIQQKCVHCNLVGINMKPMECGHVCCLDNCVESHKASQDNKDCMSLTGKFLIFDDCQN